MLLAARHILTHRTYEDKWDMINPQGIYSQVLKTMESYSMQFISEVQ